ncbi:hypothetical protein [Cochlodiniinecator piscidefendens]|uniref:hypothetical protein n=1 Tax=Cochlodiniinecator piscidefendens TaxID=2715756 RepID=UPI00140AF68C|nr:hypothetical protein [Cochlodiniinecator piscidefendens]
MKRTLTAIATVATLSLGVTAPAASAMQMEHNMLTGAIFNALHQMNLPTDHIQDLSLGEIAQIHFILSGDGEDGGMKQAIQVILDRHM